jgi:hypothetical protein
MAGGLTRHSRESGNPVRRVGGAEVLYRAHGALLDPRLRGDDEKKEYE